MNHYRIESGKVVPCSAFDVLGDSVTASNKTKATEKLLTQLEKIKAFGGPQLRISGRAFLIIHHNGNHLVTESGTIDRPKSPLCIGGADTLANAEKDTSFAYYSSPDYAAATS